MMERSVWPWLRGQHVTICGEVLRVDNGVGGEGYAPFEMLNLPNALARVDKEEAALDFTTKFGLLGYSRLSESSADLRSTVRAIRAAVDRQDWTAADREAARTDYAWTQVRTGSTWPASNLAAFKTALAQLRASIEAKDRAAAERDLARLERSPLLSDYDPIPWVLMHAQAVKFALQILEAHGRGDTRTVLRILDEHKSVDPMGDEPKTLRRRRTKAIVEEEPAVEEHHPPEPRQGWLLPGGITPFFFGESAVRCYVEREFTSKKSNGTPKVERIEVLEARALWLVARLVNENTSGVSRGLYVNGSGEFAYGYSARALIEAIWWLVGETAIRFQNGGQRSRFRLCKECLTPFLALDERQEYCPPYPFSKAKRLQSPCAVRARKDRPRRARHLYAEGKSLEEVAAMVGSDVETVRGWVEKGVRSNATR